MLEATLIDYLGDELKIDVYAEKPEIPPDIYLLVQRTGSSAGNKLVHASIAIQSYAPTMYEAAELNEAVKDVMDIDNVGSIDSIAGCHLDTDYNFTDTSQKAYRYQAVFDVSYYEQTYSEIS